MNCRIEAACASHIGRVRRNNEDNFLFNGQLLPEQNDAQPEPLTLCRSARDGEVLAVFDGMGGGDWGEAASFAAACALKEQPLTGGAPEKTLRSAVQQLNGAVLEAQKRLGSTRVGSTMAALLLSGGWIFACNVGDSRIFGLRQHQLMQISQDHTDEAYMKSRGITGRKPRLTQYLGMDPRDVILDPFVTRGSLEAGDLYLICSDGLTDMLSEDEIRGILDSGQSMAQCVRQLVAQALQQGGRDNVTVIACRILECNDTGRKEDDTDAGASPVAWVAGDTSSWGRKLWQSLRDSAGNFRRRN